MMIKDSAQTSSKQVQELNNIVKYETLLIINRSLQKISTDQGQDYVWRSCWIFRTRFFRIRIRIWLTIMQRSASQLPTELKQKIKPKRAFTDAQTKTVQLELDFIVPDWTGRVQNSKYKKFNPKQAFTGAQNKDWTATAYLQRFSDKKLTRNLLFKHN